MNRSPSSLAMLTFGAQWKLVPNWRFLIFNVHPTDNLLEGHGLEGGGVEQDCMKYCRRNWQHSIPPN